MTKLPSEIEVDASADGDPLEGAWIQLTLRMTAKNDFNLLIGPTDVTGRIVVRAEELVRQIEGSRDLAPMDYASLESWDGLIDVVALNREGANRALAAVEIWGTGVALKSDEDVRRLEAYARRLEALEGQVLTVDVREQPTVGVRVETRATFV